MIQFVSDQGNKVALLSLLEKKQIIQSRESLTLRQNRRVLRQSLLQEILDRYPFHESAVHQILSSRFALDVVDVEKTTVDEKVLRLLKFEWIKKYNCFPLALDKGVLIVAMTDPLNVIVHDDLSFLANLPIQAVIASKRDIHTLIDKYFRKSLLNESLDQVVEFSDEQLEVSSPDAYAAVASEQSPISNLVESFLINAIQMRASDVHIEPLDSVVELRYRIDGILKSMIKIPKNVQKHLISRIKIISDLDISECRRPQDGRVKMTLQDRKVDLRVSIIPTICGEKVVIRILDAKDFQFNLDNIGLTPEHQKLLRGCIKQPQGMVLVTGPTGSGKTSTLYSVLNEIKTPANNIVTVEDPVEYVINGINQIQVNEKIGVTFANGLRSILRQDPDVIFVGEIRDRETAEIAIRSSLTGHMVFSTLHTNCSISTIHRLRNIGVDTFLIASSILAVVAQRLVRVNCQECTHPYTPAKELLKKFQRIMPAGMKTFHKGRGCEKCHFTGYKNRMAIFEILPFKPEIKKMINDGASEDEILFAARKTGFKTLIEKALDLVHEGKTTLEEVERSCGYRDHHDHHEHHAFGDVKPMADYLDEIDEFSKQIIIASSVDATKSRVP